MELYHSDMRGLLTTSPKWSGAGSFVRRLISLFPMACMFLIWLYMNLFSWRLVLMISLSLWAVMACALLNFPVSFWLEMAFKNCSTDVASFLPMLRIQKPLLFLAGNAWFYGLLFSDWVMYDVLLCSQYCVIMAMGVHIGRNLTFPSNISYLIKGCSESSIFNVGRM